MRKRKVFRETVITVIVIAFEEKTMVCELGNYVFANSTSKCKITKCFCKSTPLVLRNSISFLVSH